MLLEDVPQGHKAALTDISYGGEVRRYNEVVSYAKYEVKKALGCLRKWLIC